MTTPGWFFWLLFAWLALGALSTVAMVGKARKPTTPEQAVIAICLEAALLVGMAMLVPH